MCGVNNYTIIDDLKHYNLVVITRFTLYGELTEVEKLMERILPMNIHYTIKNQLQRSASGTVCIQNISISFSLVISGLVVLALLQLTYVPFSQLD